MLKFQYYSTFECLEDMAIKDLCKDVIDIYDTNGQLVAKSIKSIVAKKSQIITFETKYKIEMDYEIHRILPNGGVEKYVVIEATYSSGINDAFYSLEVENLNSKKTHTQPTSSIVTNYNFTNSQLNQNSSHSTLNITTSIFQNYDEILNKILADLKDLDLPEEDKIFTKGILDKISIEVKQSEPNKSKLETFFTLFPAAVSVLSSTQELAKMISM